MKFINILVVVALMTGGLHLHAQTAHVEYTTELQTNFRESNFANLLRLNAEVPIGKSVTIGASTISIAKTRDERLATPWFYTEQSILSQSALFSDGNRMPLLFRKYHQRLFSRL